MALVIDRLNNFVAHWRELPESTATADELATKKIDAAEFQKSRPVRDALRELAVYIEGLATDPRMNAKLSSVPDALQQKIADQVAVLDNIVLELGRVWAEAPASGNQPPRWPPGKFDSTAAEVRSKYGDLYQAVEPFRDLTPDDFRDQIARLENAVEQSRRQETAAKQTQQELEDAEKNAAAYVLSEINVTEIDSAITVHRRSAALWLVAAIISAAAAVRIAWWVNVPNNEIFTWKQFPQPVTDPLRLPDVLLSLGRKVLLLSAVFAVPIFALRVYYTNLHNLIVNRQRKISTVAFTKLLALMKDSDVVTKTELVKLAAQTIFTQGTTGFLSKSRGEMPIADVLTALIRSGSYKG